MGSWHPPTPSWVPFFQESEEIVFFWETTSGWIPYSALLGWTVDTCVRQVTEALWFRLQKLRSLRSCSSSLVFDILFVRSLIPMVQTIHCRRSNLVVDVPVMQTVHSLRCRRGEDIRALTVASRGRSHSCLGAEADPHGPPWLRVAENCGFSAVAAHFQGRRLPCRTAEAHPHDQAVQQTIVIPLLPYLGGPCPCVQVVQISFVAQRQISMVQTVRRTIVIPQLQFTMADVPDAWSRSS